MRYLNDPVNPSRLPAVPPLSCYIAGLPEFDHICGSERRLSPKVHRAQRAKFELEGSSR